MKHICRLFIITLSFCFYVASAVGQTVDIPDSNLRAEIEAALGKTSGATITIADMVTLTQFDLGLNADTSNLTVSNLTGLEHAINLTGRGLVIDNISHLSRLGNLDSLEWLFLWGNNISSVSGLSNLNSLEWFISWGQQYIESLKLNRRGILRTNNRIRLLAWLFLGDNNISGSFSLANLDNLRGLHLGDNNISSLSNEWHADNLEWLFLGGNNISGSFSLANLDNLRGLHLGDQQYIESLK